MGDAEIDIMEPIGKIVIENKKFYIILTETRREDLEIAKVDLTNNIADHIINGWQKDIDKTQISKEEDEETGQKKRKQDILDYVKSKIKYD
jgi:hypothetical protein